MDSESVGEVQLDVIVVGEENELVGHRLGRGENEKTLSGWKDLREEIWSQFAGAPERFGERFEVLVGFDDLPGSNAAESTDDQHVET